MTHPTITIEPIPVRPENLAEVFSYYQYWSACDDTARRMEADLLRISGEPWSVSFVNVVVGPRGRTETQAVIVPAGPVREEFQ